MALRFLAGSLELWLELNSRSGTHTIFAFLPNLLTEWCAGSPRMAMTLLRSTIMQGQ